MKQIHYDWALGEKYICTRCNNGKYGSIVAYSCFYINLTFLIVREILLVTDSNFPHGPSFRGPKSTDGNCACSSAI